MLDLVLNVGMEEVKKALFEMKPWKAPGLDSFHVGFIQNKWSLVGRDICVDVNNVLQGGAFLPKNIPKHSHIPIFQLSFQGLKARHD